VTIEGSQGHGSQESSDTGVKSPQAGGSIFDIRHVFDDGEWKVAQKKLLALLCLVAVVDGIDAQVLSLALPSMAQDWAVSRSAFSLVMALGLIGMAAGTVLGGALGDRIGRKPAILLATSIFGAFTLLTALCSDVASLGILRTISAIGLGGAMPNVASMVSESTPRAKRSMALTICMSGLPLGGVALGLLGAVILPRFGWRTLFVIAGTLPLALCALLAGKLHESVRYLVRQKANTARIEKILGQLGHAPPRHVAFYIDGADTAQGMEEPPSRTLLLNFARDSVLLGLGFFFLVFSIYLIFTWAPTLLNDLGYSEAFIGSGMAAFSAGGLVGGLLGVRLINRFGSRIALTGMSAAGSASVIALGFVLRGGGAPQALLLAGLAVAGLALPGAGTAIYVLAGQIFPTAIRARGVGFAAGLGRLGAVTSALAGPFLLASDGTRFFPVVAVTMAAVGFALILITRHLAPTDEKGRGKG
jgi:AAHS family 4-hydroxybenzoate transporter-like MFS transporter